MLTPAKNGTVEKRWGGGGEALPLLKKPVIELVTVSSAHHILAQFDNNKQRKRGAEMAQKSFKSIPHLKLWAWKSVKSGLF